MKLEDSIGQENFKQAWNQPQMNLYFCAVIENW